MSIALIGCGHWGKNIMRVLSEHGLLRLVYDVRKIDSPQYVDSLDAIWNDRETQGVIVATPAATHFGIAKQALLAGKHVLVEKPFVLFSGHAEELIALAEKQERILMVGHLLHYHPAIRRAKEIVSNGVLGRLRYITASRLNFGKIRTEENVWWSFAPHDVSLILSIVGREPKSVFGYGFGFVNPGIADMTTTVMKFDEMAAHIYVSWLHPFKEHRMVITGESGSLVFDGGKNELMLYQHYDDREMVGCPLYCEKDEPLRVEIKHFVDCIKTGARPLTDGNEGLRVVKVLEQAEAML